MAIGIRIDELTHSIRSREGEEFQTVVSRLRAEDLKYVLKEKWAFDWKRELRSANRHVYMLATEIEPGRVQGLISFEDKGDHMFMHLIESAQNNRGRDKDYTGVAGNLVAYGCRLAFDLGYKGYVSFISKSRLKEHYATTLKAEVLHGNQMVIRTAAALELTTQYFPGWQGPV